MDGVIKTLTNVLTYKILGPILKLTSRHRAARKIHKLGTSRSIETAEHCFTYPSDKTPRQWVVGLFTKYLHDYPSVSLGGYLLFGFYVLIFIRS